MPASLRAIDFGDFEYSITRIMRTTINSDRITKNCIPTHDLQEQIMAIIL